MTVRARAQPQDKATTAEVRSLRECNGAVQWLAKENRPDLAGQVSLSQQALSDPRVRHCRQANAMVRRARQHHEWAWRFLPVPLENSRLVMHTDAAFQNAQGRASQAGYIIAVTDDRLARGELAPWSPLTVLGTPNGLPHTLLEHAFQILMWLNGQPFCDTFGLCHLRPV